jgi:hypothetical protein
MESEGSLPYSQEPAADHYPESDGSSPHVTIQFLWDLFRYYPTIYA